MFKFVFLIIFILSSPFVFAETAHDSMAEIHFGLYTPNIDQEAELTKPIYEDIFGKDGTVFGLNYSFQVFSDNYIGTFSILSGISYFNVSGYGMYQEKPIGYVHSKDEDGKDIPYPTGKSNDSTEFSMIPFELAVVYNLDQLERLFAVPLVFYAKIGLNYNLWWSTDGNGETVTVNDKNSSGGKKGWHYGLGIRFLLDILDPVAAVKFDNEYGVNGSYIFIEYNSSTIDDFGAKGFKLGGDYWRFGLALEF